MPVETSARAGSPARFVQRGTDAAVGATLLFVAESMRTTASAEACIVFAARRDCLVPVMVSGEPDGPATSNAVVTSLMSLMLSVRLMRPCLRRRSAVGDVRAIPGQWWRTMLPHLAAGHLAAQAALEVLDVFDGDLIIAPLRKGASQDPLGLIVTLTRESRTLNGQLLRLMENRAAEVAAATLLAFERHEQSAAARRADRRRAVIRDAGTGSLHEALHDSSEGLRGCFDLVTLRSRIYEAGQTDPADAPMRIAYAGHAGEPLHLRRWADRTTDAATWTLWHKKRVGIVSLNQTDPLPTSVERVRLQRLLREAGRSSMVLVPLGLTTCIGSLTLIRDRDRPAWTEEELAAAADLRWTLGPQIEAHLWRERQQRTVRKLPSVGSQPDRLSAAIALPPSPRQG